MATQMLLPSEFERLLERAGPEFARLLRREMEETGLRMEAAGKLNARNRMKTPTGNLSRSIGHEVRGSGATLETSLRAGGRLAGRGDVVYARIQELGGVVRPTRAKWLAIPTDSVKTAAGASRYASPRDYPKPLRFVFLLFGLAALVEDMPDGTMKARWWLKKKTTIRPKHYLRDAHQEAAKGLPERVAGAFRDALVPAVGAA